MFPEKLNMPAFTARQAFLSWVVVGVIIRLIYVSFFYRDLLAGDALFYYQDASLLAEGKFPGTYWPPGMAFYLSPFIKIIGFSPIATVVGMLVVYVFFMRKLNHVMERFLDRSVVNLSHAFFAIYPAFIHHSVAPLSHLPVAVCLLWLADELWKIHLTCVNEGKLRWKSVVYVGILLGVGALFRPGLLIILPVIIVFFFWQLRGAGFSVLIPLTIVAVLIGGWEWWAKKETDRWVMINDATAMNIYLGNNEYTPMYRTWWLGSQDERSNPQYENFYLYFDAIKKLPVEEQGKTYREQAWEHIKDKPGLFALRTFNRIRCFFAFDTFTGSRTLRKNVMWGTIFLVGDAICYVLIGFLAMWGMVGKGTLMPYKIRRTWLFLILVYAIPYFLAFSHPTYHLPIVPLMAVFAAAALVKSDPMPFSFGGFPPRIKPFVYLAFLVFLYIQFEWIANMVDRYVALGGSF